MEKVPDWLKLWEQLVENQNKAFFGKKRVRDDDDDFWRHKAKEFEKMAKKRKQGQDSSSKFIADTLKDNPGSTLLDIGAGTGVWSEYLAQFARSVTALEPSDAMGEFLRKKIDDRKIDNIRLVKGGWPDVDIEAHDYLLASHSMYGVRDFRGFIQKMAEKANKRCFLCMKALHSDTIMAKATRRVWGQPFDSPNFQIALNALHQMDIYPNVLMETGGSMGSWTSESMEDALNEIKTRLGIDDTTVHDDYLHSLLDGALTFKEGKWAWPAGNSSALVYWDV